MVNKIEIINWTRWSRGDNSDMIIKVLWHNRSDGPDIHYLGIGPLGVKNNYAKLRKLKMGWGKSTCPL